MTDFTDALSAFDGAIRRTLQTCRALPSRVWSAPVPGRLSIAEVVEHMALSNSLFERRLAFVFDTAAVPHPFTVLEDAEIPHLFERATEPPGIAEPTGQWRDKETALARFEASARPISEMALRDAKGLRSKGAPHPLFGPLDGVQWLLFAAAHNERHRSEIIGLAASTSQPAA